METTTSPTTAPAVATVTVTAAASPYFQSQGTARGPAVPYGFITLIIILGLLLILSLGCVGHGFLLRRRARRRGEDPGPVFGYWWWQSRPLNQTQGHGLQPVSGVGMQGDGRGREYYNVADATTVGRTSRTEQDLKGGGEVGMARYA